MNNDKASPISYLWR